MLRTAPTMPNHAAGLRRLRILQSRIPWMDILELRAPRRPICRAGEAWFGRRVIVGRQVRTRQMARRRIPDEARSVSACPIRSVTETYGASDTSNRFPPGRCLLL